MVIKAILSDLDKTLIEDSLVPEQIAKAVKKYLKISQDEASRIVGDFYDIQTSKAHFLNGYSKVGAWKKVFEKNQIDYSYKQLYELNNIFWTTAAKFARPYPNVLQTIATIKQHGLLFGIVSGGDYITRYQHLSTTHILPFADVVVTTEEIGMVKHHRNLYSVAADELGVAFPNAIAIGDNEVADIQLPKEDGFITVKIGKKDEKTRANFCIESFPQIMEILVKLEAIPQ